MALAVVRALDATLAASRRVHAALVAAVAVALYLGTLSNGFGFDTPELVLHNPAVHGFSRANLEAIFTSVPNSVEYLPIRDLTYMLDHQLWGLRPLGYNLSNVLYYALACVALYLFLERLLGRWTPTPRGSALVVTILFAVHPVHVESVAGVAQRKDLVSGLFFFLGLWAFLWYREHGGLGRYLVALAAFALAMLSKATAVVLPGIVLLLVLPDVRRGRRWLAELAGFVIVAAAISWLFLRIAVGAGTAFTEGTALPLRVATAAKVVLFYLRLLAVPHPLTIMHEVAPVPRLLDPVGLASLAAVVAGASLIAWRARRWPVLAFGVAWFAVTVLPVCGLLPAPNLAAERYLFLPVAGFALAVGGLLLAPTTARWRLAVAAAALLLVGTHAALVVARTRDFRTNERLLVADHGKSPGSLRLTRLVGRYYFANRRYDRAFAYFDRARAISPDDRDHVFFTAMLALRQGNPQAGLEALEPIRDDRSVDLNCLLGMLHEARGDTARAREHYRQALAGDRLMGVLFKSHARAALERLGL